MQTPVPGLGAGAARLADAPRAGHTALIDQAAPGGVGDVAAGRPAHPLA